MLGGGLPDNRRESEPDEHYFEVRLTPQQRDRLLSLLDNRQVGYAHKRQIAEAVRDARRMDGQVEVFDWKQVEKEADERGSSLADYIFDAPSRLPDDDGY